VFDEDFEGNYGAQAPAVRSIQSIQPILREPKLQLTLSRHSTTMPRDSPRRSSHKVLRGIAQAGTE
jgi:hypothetical protein